MQARLSGCRYAGAAAEKAHSRKLVLLPGIMLMYSDIVSSQEGAPPMITSSLIRWWELLGAVLGGLAWLVSVLLDSASAPQEPLFLVYAIAWLATLGGLVGLYALQASSYLLLGTSSFFAAFIGALLALAGTVLNLLSRGDLLQQGFYEQTLGLGLFITLIGVAVFGVGFTLLGVASLLGRRIPLWVGVAIIVAPLLAWLWGGYGAIVLGVVWLAVGYALWLARKEANQKTSRASEIGN